MVRQLHVDIHDSQAGSVDESEHELGIKHVMVERSMLNVVSRPGLKGVPGSGSRVATQVVERENLFNVRRIRFRHVVRKVTDYVIQRRQRSAMVERTVMVGNNQKNGPTRVDN